MALGQYRTILAACLLEHDGSILGVAAATGDDLMRSRELPEVLALIDAYITTAFKSDLQTLATVAVGDITFMLCVIH